MKRLINYFLLCILFLPFTVNAAYFDDSKFYGAIDNLKNIDFEQYGYLNVVDYRHTDESDYLILDNTKKGMEDCPDAFTYFIRNTDMDFATADEALDYFNTNREDLEYEYYNFLHPVCPFKMNIMFQNDGITPSFVVFNFNEYLIEDTARMAYADQEHKLSVLDADNSYKKDLDRYFYVAMASLFDVPVKDAINYRENDKDKYIDFDLKHFIDNIDFDIYHSCIYNNKAKISYVGKFTNNSPRIRLLTADCDGLYSEYNLNDYSDKYLTYAISHRFRGKSDSWNLYYGEVLEINLDGEFDKIKLKEEVVPKEDNIVVDPVNPETGINGMMEFSLLLMLGVGIIGIYLYYQKGRENQ